MRPGAFVPFAIAVVVLAGCTNGTSGSPGDRTSSGGPVTVAPTLSSPPATASTSTDPAPIALPADVPTTGPNLLRKGERPPVMPALATQHTPAGAVAFAKFFELTIDWGYATTSTAYMKHYYEPNCITCKSIQLGIDDAAHKHRHFLGDRLHLTAAGPAVVDSHHAADLHVDVAFQVASAEVVDERGNFVDGQVALKMTDRVWLAWRGSRWMVTEIGSLS